MQNDIHSPATTVAEALWFSGRLRLPPSISDEEVSFKTDSTADCTSINIILPAGEYIATAADRLCTSRLITASAI